MLWKFLKSLLVGRSISFWAVIIIALVLVLAGGAAFAAWSVTQEASTTAMVLGTFALDSVACDDAVPGETVLCQGQVVNQYDDVVTINSASLVSDRADITVFADWGVEGRPGQNVPQPVNPGETVMVQIQWKPQAGALLGIVNFTMQVTASAN